jgi:ketosteroid isomerase-like protein
VKHALWCLLFCPLAFGSPCPAGQTKDEAALVQAEQRWARALEEQDVAALACILADDFEDADITGALADRSQTLARAAKPRGVHHALSDLRAHRYGDFGYIRGIATAFTENGRRTLKIRFTDVYVYREGRWQCVAGHESSFPRAVR